MRPLEILVLAISAVGLLGTAAAGAWLKLLAALIILAAIAQVAVEGARWQMAPAYLLSGLLALVSLAPGAVSAWAGRQGLWVGVPLLALAVLLAALFPVFRFPKPGGPRAVGTTTYHWVDADRPDMFTDNPRDRRELMVQIWYPAEEAPALPRAPYLKGDILGPVLRLVRMPGFILSHLKHVKTNALEAAPVAAGEQGFPVLIFSHGRGGFRQHNTRLMEELASHGYVVAAIDHPHAATGVLFPDGRLVPLHPRMTDRAFVDGAIPYLAQDALFALRRLDSLDQNDPQGILTGRLDLERVGIFGVSLGGAVAAEACRVEARFRACLAVDVWMPADVLREGIRQPAMFITRDAVTMRREGWREEDIDETLRTMRSVYERLPGDGYFVQVPGMYHNDFSDAPLFSPALRWLGATGPIGAARAHAITNAYTLAFFDRHLKGLSTPLLDGPAEAYPEVLLESRG